MRTFSYGTSSLIVAMGRLAVRIASKRESLRPAAKQKTKSVKGEIMKTIKLVVAALTLVTTLAWVGQAVADEIDQKKLTTEVEEAVAAFKAADSSLTPRFTNAVGYVVFPTAGKGGFI